MDVDEENNKKKIYKLPPLSPLFKRLEIVWKTNFLEDIFKSLILQLQTDILQWNIFLYCLEINFFTFLPRGNAIPENDNCANAITVLTTAFFITKC